VSDIPIGDVLSEEEKLKKEEIKSEPVGKPIWKQVLEAPSANKPLEEYQGHALNWDGTKSTGRIIRGIEGLTGGLNTALMDIVVGTVQKLFEVFTRQKDEY